MTTTATGDICVGIKVLQPLEMIHYSGKESYSSDSMFLSSELSLELRWVHVHLHALSCEVLIQF